MSASTILGGWAAPMVSAFTAFACLTSLGSWMMLVGQAGVRAANDGNFPKVYGEVDSNGIPKKGLLLKRGENDRADGTDYPDELYWRQSF